MSYIQFTEIPDTSKKTKTFEVSSVTSKIKLGFVKFRPQWRKYIFEPTSSTIFDPECLIEIAGFLSQQTTEWRKSHSI